MATSGTTPPNPNFPQSTATAPTRLRPYQQRVVDAIGTENAIVKMPTGSGKTLVAAEIIRRGLAKTKSSKPSDKGKKQKALFLVPTCDLVEQQATAIRAWINTARIAQYMGGCSPPSENAYDILVSTPDAFRKLQQRAAPVSPSFAWQNFFIVVFDEVHHVLKDHPYRKLALGIRRVSDSSSSGEDTVGPQVLGLSASLTYAVGETSVRAALTRLSKELNISRMEAPTDAELLNGGYSPQRLGDNVERVFRHEVPEGVVPEQERKPHLMHATFMTRVKGRTATEFAQELWGVVLLLEKVAVEQKDVLWPAFVSPLAKAKLSAWEEFAHSCCESLPKKNALGRVFFRALESWYVALRILVQTWEEDEVLALQWLLSQESCGFSKGAEGGDGAPFGVMDVVKNLYVGQARVGSGSATTVDQLRKVVVVVRARADNDFNRMKLACLREQLQEKQAHFGTDFRAIVFVQQRITSYVVARFVNQACNELRNSAESTMNGAGAAAEVGSRGSGKKNAKKAHLPPLAAGFVTAKDASLTPSIKLSAANTKDTIANFRAGKLNVLVATAVVEEGFDVPEANTVISFDPLKDSVELCQRFGRARRSDSKIVVMAERADRPVTMLDRVREQQEELIGAFDPPGTVVKSAADLEKERAAQKCRERGAAALLSENSGKNGQQSVSSRLNLYVRKTKAELEEKYVTSVENGTGIGCELRYKTVLRDLRVVGHAVRGAGQDAKKEAKRAAAEKLLVELAKECK